MPSPAPPCAACSVPARAHARAWGRATRAANSPLRAVGERSSAAAQRPATETSVPDASRLALGAREPATSGDSAGSGTPTPSAATEEVQPRAAAAGARARGRAHTRARGWARDCGAGGAGAGAGAGRGADALQRGGAPRTAGGPLPAPPGPPPRPALPPPPPPPPRAANTICVL